jgi:sugar/nucleoside kinase (ribokinase family)
VSLLVVGSVAYDALESPYGKVDRTLGGAATYFAVSASFFTHVNLVAIVGDDFSKKDESVFRSRSIDIEGLERAPGKSFFWAGRYSENLNERVTLATELNVFAEFKPRLPEKYRRDKYVFLANISPELQAHVLSQVASPKVVAADTMNHWIANQRADLVKLLPRIDILTLNDEEARMLSGEHNLVKAGRAILKMGPDTVLVKRGEYGVLQFSENSIFSVPAWPLEEVTDPTGAGDTFAGALMGWIARNGRVTESILRTGVVYGSVLASYAVEDFSVNRLANLTWQDIDQRYRSFIELTDSHHSRWISQ